ncbi:MAG: glycosyltransferase family 9 protein [Proteobacteria bacterium]|nr:glycosyltransferase family 9 protein [Pseudomonadota bacterium]
MQTAFLGDTALISSMVGKIGELYGKDAEIYLIIKNGLEDLFKNDKRVRSITTFDKRGTEKDLFGLLKAIIKVRRLKLDVMFCVHRSLRSCIITAFSGAKTKIGFKEAALSSLFTKTVKREGPHEVLKNHLLLETYDPAFKKIRPLMSSKYKLYAPAKSSLDELNKTSKEPFIVIAPGSKWHTKRWGTEAYTRLAEKLLKTYNHDIVFTGDKDDEGLIENIIAGIKSDNLRKRIINQANKLDISNLMFLISKASLVITNDSAPQHIAVGFAVPVVSIFGPTVKGLGYYPFSDDAVVVEAHDVKCRPCGLHGHMKCPKKTNECMTAIKDDYVYNAVRRLI